MKSLSRLDVVFQLTPSRRATWIYRTIGEFFSFQLTPSRRATHRISMLLSRQDISTPALMEGDSGREPMTTPAAYFNSRPHGGRLLIEREESCRYISTHALTEGDDSASSAELMILSFQLTPSRRATLSWRRCFRRMRYFNSRPHGGRQNSFSQKMNS